MLPITSKITERLIQKQMLDYMEVMKQLNPANNAYRRDLNTTTTLALITDAIYKSADINEIATILTIDKSCAFDSVTHKILTDKIKLYNFDDSTKCSNWVK